MIKYLSLFSGIGAFEKAMQNLEIPYDLVGYCEIDKYASKGYSLIHHVPESKNFGDITKIDEKALPDGIDFISYGFPCQDISICGHQKGFYDKDGNKTRSGLFFDALRIITHTTEDCNCGKRKESDIKTIFKRIRNRPSIIGRSRIQQLLPSVGCIRLWYSAAP